MFRIRMSLLIVLLVLLQVSGVYVVSAFADDVPGGTISGEGSSGTTSHQAPDPSQRYLTVLKDQITSVETFDTQPAQNPMVEVANNTNQSMAIKLNGKSMYSFSMSPNTKNVMVFAPGTYQYEAQIPGFPPFSGTGTFNENARYTWTFNYANK
ncbi:MAG: hypothetical protein HQK89_16180 [Nitrospirae bacterium]|nr:hypothetical protein [Nitrospirota bacterium]